MKKYFLFSALALSVLSFGTVAHAGKTTKGSDKRKLSSTGTYHGPNSEILAKAISQVEYQLTDASTELGRAAKLAAQGDSVADSGPFAIDRGSDDFGGSDAIIVSQQGTKTETVSTLLVRVPYTDGSEMLWSRRSITATVKVTSDYEDETGLVSYQIKVVPGSVKVNKEQ